MTPARETPTGVLQAFTSGIRAALGDDLVGLYVCGSYVSGGFDPVPADR